MLKCVKTIVPRDQLRSTLGEVLAMLTNQTCEPDEEAE